MILLYALLDPPVWFQVLWMNSPLAGLPNAVGTGVWWVLVGVPIGWVMVWAL